jgi:hypothetical protein
VATLFLTCFASAVLSFDKKDKEDDKLRRKIPWSAP